MITQILDQGENKIRIEACESLEDAAKNNFRKGEYSRYYINDKPVQAYGEIISHIIKETKKNNKAFIPNTQELIQKRKDMLLEQNNLMKKQLEDLKSRYKGMGSLNEDMLNNIDSMIDRLDASGLRVKQ